MAVKLEDLIGDEELVFVPMTKALADSMRHRWTEPMMLRVDRSPDTQDPRVARLVLRPLGPMLDEMENVKSECAQLRARVRELEGNAKKKRERGPSKPRGRRTPVRSK